ncbi:MAG: type IV pili methyl-accepting chemotaxis transducer N-terminal domain-containing protein, partial [Microscillaceae bacterium]|nr:type IV pili methyl-accepting chemotaxis transducer N-terminal domain-containing protein [Microscillaceae bacterium]MDW8461378.1 type IV pili methyl-accepting chemotaxis transducer N-terminal domain-containing protein [Cytophagales bacterium]
MLMWYSSFNYNYVQNTDISIRKLSISYVIALSVIALLTLFSQYLIQQALEKQETDGTVVNIAGRQRMLSQRIVKNVLILNGRQENTVLQKALTELEASLKLWEKSHKGLQKGDKDLKLPPDANTDSIKQIFLRLNPYHITMVEASYQVIAIKKNDINASIEPYLKVLLENEGNFLKIMNEIVGMYETVAKSKVNSLRTIEILLMCITLITLLLEALLIFKPAIKRMEKYVREILIYNEKLTASEEELRQNLEELETSQELLKNQNELLTSQSNQLLASEEELRQNMEELQTIQEALVKQ